MEAPLAAAEHRRAVWLPEVVRMCGALGPFKVEWESLARSMLHRTASFTAGMWTP